MPTTAQNITRIQNRVPKYGRPEILEVLNEIQMIAYSQDVAQTIRYNPATGLLPYLATTNNIYAYNCPADCRRTFGIFAFDPISTYSRTRPVPENQRYYFNNQEYHKIAASSVDALPGGVAATVTFVENPGTTTTQFYHGYFIQPTPLNTEAVQLTIPEHLHYKLRQGVLAMLSSEEYGQTGFDTDVIQKIARDIRNQLNSGMQARSFRTPWREEFRGSPEHSQGQYI